MYLDMADWQDCTKVPQNSLLPQFLLLKGEAKRHRGKMKDADRERSEPKEMIKVRRAQCAKRKSDKMEL